MSKQFEDAVKAEAEKWAHPQLMRIWVILQFSDWIENEPVLRGNDIQEIGKAVLELNAHFNNPEIKAQSGAYSVED